MKRLISLLLVIAMALTCFALASCMKAEDVSVIATKTSDAGKTSEKPDGTTTEENVIPSDLKYVKDKGTLVVGMTEYAPMNYKETGSDEWTGFDTEFAQAVAEKLGVKVEFKEIDWDNKWLELNSKSIDCVWNGMTITDEVKKNSSCSSPYVINAQVVVMKKDAAEKYTTVESLKDLTFAVEAGSAGAEAAEEAGLEYTEYPLQSDALLAVESGKDGADGCIIDITMANAMTGEGTSYADLTAGVSLTEEEYGIAFRIGSDLLGEVSNIINGLKDDGTLTALADKYQLTLAE